MYFESHYTRQLDGTLEMARSGKYEFSPWIVIHALTGFGKTAATKAWLEHNNLKNIYIDAACLNIQNEEVDWMPANDLKVPEGKEFQAQILDKDTMTRLFTPYKKTIQTIFPHSCIDDIDKETVIVIDNYDKASQEVRDELMKLIHFHQIVDVRESENEFIKEVDPLMLVVIVDEAQLITKAPLTVDELKLFGLEEFIKYIK